MVSCPYYFGSMAAHHSGSTWQRKLHGQEMGKRLGEKEEEKEKEEKEKGEGRERKEEREQGPSVF